MLQHMRFCSMKYHWQLLAVLLVKDFSIYYSNYCVQTSCLLLPPCRSDDIYDFVYIDAFGKGKQLTAKECEYLIGHQVTADYYSAINTTEVLLRMVGNLLNIGKRG